MRIAVFGAVVLFAGNRSTGIYLNSLNFCGCRPQGGSSRNNKEYFMKKAFIILLAAGFLFAACDTGTRSAENTGNKEDITPKPGLVDSLVGTWKGAEFDLTFRSDKTFAFNNWLEGNWSSASENTVKMEVTRVHTDFFGETVMERKWWYAEDKDALKNELGLEYGDHDWLAWWVDAIFSPISATISAGNFSTIMVLSFLPVSGEFLFYEVEKLTFSKSPIIQKTLGYN
jgi:hypothetical protein